jgi:hypothetical protein
LAINIAQRFNLSGQAASVRGLSFAFFPICSLFGFSAPAARAIPSMKAEFSALPRSRFLLN